MPLYCVDCAKSEWEYGHLICYVGGYEIDDDKEVPQACIDKKYFKKDEDKTPSLFAPPQD